MPVSLSIYGLIKKSLTRRKLTEATVDESDYGLKCYARIETIKIIRDDRLLISHVFDLAFTLNGSFQSSFID